jgi:hypothetical protein
LEDAGAPTGSELHFERDGAGVVVPFGKQQALTIYLDGVTLPAEIYQQADGAALVDQINATIAGHGGAVRDYWDGPRDTAVYVYGPNAELLWRQLEPALLGDPQCQNARIVIKNGRQDAERVIRLPGD